mmetsp:Transcript_45435/g.67486  ORF Transcript_45435/g.67486 Transcript_45435/m.67486 type:complete len:96 (+) Transcript_45435:153-440(+)
MSYFWGSHSNINMDFQTPGFSNRCGTKNNPGLSFVALKAEWTRITDIARPYEQRATIRFEVEKGSGSRRIKSSNCAASTSGRLHGPTRGGSHQCQ